MTVDTDGFVEKLHELVAEIERVTARRHAGKHIGGRLQEAAAGLQRVLSATQRRVGSLQTKLERRVGRTAKAANATVRRSPWGAVAVAAAAALLLGFALARGSASFERPL